MVKKSKVKKWGHLPAIIYAHGKLLPESWGSVMVKDGRPNGHFTGIYKYKEHIFLQIIMQLTLH